MGEGKLCYLYFTFRRQERLRILPNKLNPVFQPTVLNEQHPVPLSLLIFLSLMYHQETQKLVGFFHMEIDRSMVLQVLSSKTEGQRLKSLSQITQQTSETVAFQLLMSCTSYEPLGCAWLLHHVISRAAGQDSKQHM